MSRSSLRRERGPPGFCFSGEPYLPHKGNEYTGCYEAANYKKVGTGQARDRLRVQAVGPDGGWCSYWSCVRRALAWAGDPEMCQLWAGRHPALSQVLPTVYMFVSLAMTPKEPLVLIR